MPFPLFEEWAEWQRKPGLLVDDEIDWRPTVAIHGPQSLTIELTD